MEKDNSDIKTELLVRIALENGLVPEEAINQILRERIEAKKNGQPVRKLGEILVERGLIDFDKVRMFLKDKSARQRPEADKEVSATDHGHFEEEDSAIMPADALTEEEQEQDDQGLLGPDEDPGETMRREQQARYGEYRILQRLGRDVNGVTYRAVHMPDHRGVTLRILSMKLTGATQEDVDRFMSTIKRAYKLDHPRIQKILTAGRQNQRLYYTAEYFTGHSLRKELASQGTLPVERTVAMAIEAADALAFAHEREMLHTQLDPSKLILGKDGHIKLIGFGLGVDATKNLDWLANSLGDLPYYVAPEMATGEEGRKLVGPVTDLYSLGAILFHCLTGQPPFHGDSLEEVLLDMYQAENLADRIEAIPDIPQELSNLVLELLNPEPGKRVQTAVELKKRLEKLDLAPLAKAKAASVAEPAVEVKKHLPHAGHAAPAALGKPNLARKGSGSGHTGKSPRVTHQALGLRESVRVFMRARSPRFKYLAAAGALLLVGGVTTLAVYLQGRTANKHTAVVNQRIKEENAKQMEQIRRTKEMEQLKEDAKKEVIKALQVEEQKKNMGIPISFGK